MSFNEKGVNINNLKLLKSELDEYESEGLAIEFEKFSNFEGFNSDNLDKFLIIYITKSLFEKPNVFRDSLKPRQLNKFVDKNFEALTNKYYIENEIFWDFIFNGHWIGQFDQNAQRIGYMINNENLSYNEYSAWSDDFGGWRDWLWFVNYETNFQIVK